MGLKYLRNDKISELETNIELNIENYANFNTLTEESDYLESNLPSVKLELYHKENSNTFDELLIFILYV